MSLGWGAQKLTRDNLKVIWVEFSTLSVAVFVMSVIEWHRQAHPHLKLKMWPRFCLDSVGMLVCALQFDS
jgi:hypothetical protein